MQTNRILCLAVVLSLSACSIWTAPVSAPADDGRRAAALLNGGAAAFGRTVLSSGGRDYQSVRPEYMPLLLAAERQAGGKVRSVLTQGRVMALLQREVVRGSCWDYLDTVFNRAGVPQRARKTVHKGVLAGPYAHPDQIRAGDWIYHINHNYKNNEHSGMFIGWVDKERRLGLTLSYAGEGRKDPARYKVYDLSSVYNIMRAQ